MVTFSCEIWLWKYSEQYVSVYCKIDGKAKNPFPRVWKPQDTFRPHTTLDNKDHLNPSISKSSSRLKITSPRFVSRGPEESETDLISSVEGWTYVERWTSVEFEVKCIGVELSGHGNLGEAVRLWRSSPYLRSIYIADFYPQRCQRPSLKFLLVTLCCPSHNADIFRYARWAFAR